MRILFFITEMAAGGAERVVSILANAMAQMGHRVTVVEIGGGEEPFYELAPGVNLIPLRLTKKRDPHYRTVRNRLLMMRRIRSVVSEQRPSVVYSFINITNVTVLLALVGMHVPVVVSERTDPFKAEIPRYWQWLMRVTYPMADAVVVQNEHVRSYFEGWWPSPRLVVIPNPVPRCRDDHESTELEGTIRLITVGRLIASKRHDILVKMMASLPESYHLHVLGDGPSFLALQKMAKELQVAQRVHWHGRVKDVYRYLRSSHLFVTGTEYEGQPNAVLEAMACGLPVVATNIPSIKEIMPDGYPYLVEPGDVNGMVRAVSDLTVDDSLLHKVGSRLRQMVEHGYDPRTITLRWLELVQ